MTTLPVSSLVAIAIAIAMAEVDRFKSVNDEHRHPTGDLVLKEIARRSAVMMSKGAAFSRNGGVR